jgi:hypothetical protein
MNKELRERVGRVEELELEIHKIKTNAQHAAASAVAQTQNTVDQLDKQSVFFSLSFCLLFCSVL